MIGDKPNPRWFEKQPSAETLAHHAQHVDQLRRRHPELFNAPQPGELPAEAFDGPKAAFDSICCRIADGAFRLRDPSPTTSGLVPTASVGKCLAPVIAHGDTTWFDPMAVPQHGDFVSVIFTAEALEFIYAFLRGKYGDSAQRPSPLCGKLLGRLGDRWFLMTNGGSIPLAAAERICGVLRRVERNGEPMYA